jgi:hypothetical protein
MYRCSQTYYIINSNPLIFVASIQFPNPRLLRMSMFRSPFCVWSFFLIFTFAMMCIQYCIWMCHLFLHFTSEETMCMFKVLLLMITLIYDLTVRMEACHGSGKISLWEKNLMLISLPRLAHLTSVSLLVSSPFCLQRMYKFSLNTLRPGMVLVPCALSRRRAGHGTSTRLIFISL